MLDGLTVAHELRGGRAVHFREHLGAALRVRVGVQGSEGAAHEALELLVRKIRHVSEIGHPAPIEENDPERAIRPVCGYLQRNAGTEAVTGHNDISEVERVDEVLDVTRRLVDAEVHILA